MPALKMKAKPSKDFLGEGHSLHPCRKLTKMPKGSYFQVKTSHQEAVLDTSIQDPQDVLSNIEVSGQKNETAEAVDHETIHGAFSQFLKWPLSSPDSTSIGRMGSQSATCPPILETIFSPTFEHDEVEHEAISHDNADEQPDLPHLVADESDDGSCSSTDYQACNVSDYCISDLSAPVSFDRDLGFYDVTADTCFDYEHIDSDLMFDMAERYMILPFIENTRETSNVHDKDSVEEAVANSDDACLYLAIHQIKADQDISCHSGDREELDSFDPQLFIRNLPDISEAVSSLWPVWIPKETRKRKAITLVLDLDETLVHSSLEHCADADFTFPVFFNMKEHTVYVRQRPYLLTFLERVAQMFEIIIFTASQSIYAEQLLDILDPDKKLISQRIYRESCIFSDGSYVKDLTILGVDLAKVAIIDNSPQVFRLQLNNGIPIKSWFDDPSDSALISLLPFLETLVDADDVRPIIAKRFNNKE